jgi:excisionase family DNA binding protein
MRDTDKLRTLVKPSSQQLSLPLVDSHLDERPPKGSHRQAAKQKSRRIVVSGRSQSHANRVAESAAASSAPALLTTQEAATLLHVHPRTVQRLAVRGELTAVRLGAAVRFDPADVVDLTERLKRRGGATSASRKA